MRLGSISPLTSNSADAGAGLLVGQALERHGRGDQVGDADAGRAGAQEQDALVAQLAAGDAQGAEDPGQGHAAVPWMSSLKQHTRSR